MRCEPRSFPRSRKERQGQRRVNPGAHVGIENDSERLSSLPELHLSSCKAPIPAKRARLHQCNAKREQLDCARSAMSACEFAVQLPSAPPHEATFLSRRHRKRSSERTLRASIPSRRKLLAGVRLQSACRWRGPLLTTPHWKTSEDSPAAGRRSPPPRADALPHSADLRTGEESPSPRNTGPVRQVSSVCMSALHRAR
jgi:hypothetical protein